MALRRVGPVRDRRQRSTDRTRHWGRPRQGPTVEAPAPCSLDGNVATVQLFGPCTHGRIGIAALLDAYQGSGGVYDDPAGDTLRIDVAVALVRALGLGSEAQAMAGQDVTATYQGETVVVEDNDLIPSALRGYVQIALDWQVLQAFFSFEQGPFYFQPRLVARVEPNDTLTRAFMAFALDHFRQHFVSGN